MKTFNELTPEEQECVRASLTQAVRHQCWRWRAECDIEATIDGEVESEEAIKNLAMIFDFDVDKGEISMEDTRTVVNGWVDEATRLEV